MAATTNGYEDEHAARGELFRAARRNGFDITKYAVGDKKGNDEDKPDTRFLTITLDVLREERPQLWEAIHAALDEHGYVIDSLQVAVKASKDISNQMLFEFAAFAA